MYQFINGSEEAFADMERRTHQACIVFREEMPPGSTPDWARIGFEVNPQDGSATLFVEANLLYVGESLTIKQWFDAGMLQFGSFQQMREWIQRDLAVAYNGPDPNISQIDYTTGGEQMMLETITDMPKLMEEVEARNRLKLIDQELLYNGLAARVRGQDDALRILSRRVARHASKENPGRPLTIFAVGPTGVGKTQTAETLTEVLGRNDRDRPGYLRIDCSEYSEQHRVSQLLGAPPGYVGYGNHSPLVNTLTGSPKCVILFDEIEKAHPDVLRTLMNAMDAGRLSAPSIQGRGAIDCRQTIFFFTSNLNCEGILREVAAHEAFQDAARIDGICRSGIVKAGIQPELAGRMGCFLVFQPLSKSAQAEVMILSIVDIGREYGVDVARVEPSVIASIMDSSFTGDFGARPARNVIEDTLGLAFAEAHSDGVQVVNVTGPPFTCLPFNGGD